MLFFKSEGGVKTFGRILAVWIFILAALLPLAGGYATYVGFSRRVHAADALGREALRPDLGHLLTSQSDVRRSRSAFMTTDTELSAIAAPAKTGESSNPNGG